MSIAAREILIQRLVIKSFKIQKYAQYCAEYQQRILKLKSLNTTDSFIALLEKKEVEFLETQIDFILENEVCFDEEKIK